MGRSIKAAVLPGGLIPRAQQKEGRGMRHGNGVNAVGRVMQMSQGRSSELNPHADSFAESHERLDALSRVPNDIVVWAPRAGFTEYDDSRAAEAKHGFFVTTMISGIEPGTARHGSVCSS
jgi:hypothetical protein